MADPLGKHKKYLKIPVQRAEPLQESKRDVELSPEEPKGPNGGFLGYFGGGNTTRVIWGVFHK